MASSMARVRHRIQEITLEPNESEFPIELRLLVDGKPVYGFPPIKPGDMLSWDLVSLPCDVHLQSQVALMITEKHQFTPRNRVGFQEYRVSEVENLSTISLEAALPTPGSLARRFGTKNRAPDLYIMKIRFLNLDEIEGRYADALDKAGAIAILETSPLGRNGRIGVVFKVVLEFTIKVAEFHKSSKMVAVLWTKAWESFEKLNHVDSDIRIMIDGLERLLPFIEAAKIMAEERALIGVLSALLDLIEDTSSLIIQHLSHTPTVRLLHTGSGESTYEQVTTLLQQFGDLKESFDRSLGVQVHQQVLSTAERIAIDRLRPSARSHYAGTPQCLDGTRERLLEEVSHWIHEQDTENRFLWIYGLAGTGKSSIASSICRMLDEQDLLGAPFFCRRDDPDLRHPEGVFNTIVYRLASHYDSYGLAVASAIESNMQLPDSPLEQRYVQLVERPLNAHKAEKNTPSNLVIVVDALDECEPGHYRQLLLTYLYNMSRLVPWLKVIITSRPEHSIKALLDSLDITSITTLNLNYETSNDVYAFIQRRMHGIALECDLPEWPQDDIEALSARASGLFIWAETVGKFIESGSNPNARLRRILEGTESAPGYQRLDLLYTNAIRSGMDTSKVDMHSLRLCIRAIVSTSVRMPLSVSSLESLLSPFLEPGVLGSVVKQLGSVIYEDHTQGGVVRPYHPSFSEYVANPARSQEFFMNEADIDLILSNCCLKTMIRELRYNMCGLETPNLRNCDIPDLNLRVRSAIGEHLKYSCLHWSIHLTKAPQASLGGDFDDFLFGETLLYWIESLGLLERLDSVAPSLLAVENWAPNTMVRHSKYANEVRQLVLDFYDPISESTLNLYVSALASAPKGSELAERMQPLFQLSAERSITMSHQKAVNTVAVSSDGRYIASGSDDNTVQVWNADTGAAAAEPMLGHSDAVTSVSFSPDCSRIVSGSKDRDLRIWNVETGVAVSEPLTGHSGAVESVAFSPDNRLIISSSWDKTIRIWDLNTRATLAKTLGGHTRPVSSVTFSPCGMYIISGCHDRIVRLWDLGSWTTVFHFRGHSGSITTVACSPDGQHVASGSHDETVQIWDAKTGGAVHDPLIGHEGPVTSVTFSSNSRFIVSGSLDGTIRIWDTGSTTPELDSLTGHSGSVTSVACFPNSHRVVSGSSDNTVRIWETKMGTAASKQPSGLPPAAHVSISGTMTTPEVVKHLVDHNCTDISGKLNMSRCSTTPVAGGGYGDVYMGMLRDGCHVAIKTARMHVPSSREGSEALKKIAHELYVWSKCRHENVLELYGVVQFRGHIAMVAPWMNNGPLRSYLERRSDLPIVDRYQLCTQMANGLSYLHQINAIHGDVKGDNVLISEDGTAKLTDFGNTVLKVYTLQFSAEKSSPGCTLRWAAPEILENRVPRCFEADVYALGMTFLEALTGKWPYDHIRTENAVLTAIMIKKELPARPDVIRAGSKNGDEVWSLLRSCWAYELEERPKSKEILETMRLIAQGS